MALFFVRNITFSQASKFELNGYIKGLKSGKIELKATVNQNIECVQNKKLLQNGKFKFLGKISDPAEVRIVLNDTLFTQSFFLEAGKQYTIINIDSLSEPLIIKGSKTNNEYLNTYYPKMGYYEIKRQNWYSDIWSLENAYHQKLPVSIKDSMENIYKLIGRQKDSALFDYIKTYPASKVAVWNLYYRVYGKGYGFIYESAYNLLDKKLKRSPTGTALKILLNAGRQTVEGAIFPRINVIDSFGNFQYGFTQGLHKFTLIDFWFSDCLPCIRQFEELKNIYLVYQSKGFTITGVSIDSKENEIKWRNTIRKYELLWPQSWDTDGKEAARLSIRALPSNFLLDNKGKIIARNLEPFQVEKFLKTNL